MSDTMQRLPSAAGLVPMLLLLASLLHGAPSFFMPDEADDALAHLHKRIAAARHTLTLITPQFHSRELERAVVKAVERGVSVTLVTSGSDADHGASLVRFRGVAYRIAHGQLVDDYDGALALTFMIVDDAYACSSSLPFRSDAFSHDIGLLECSDAPPRLATYRDAAKRIIERSRPYLQP